MKPTIYLFGIPTFEKTDLIITIFHKINDGSINGNFGDLIYETRDNSKNMLIVQSDTDIKIGDIVTFSVMSSGIVPYQRKVSFKGGDISHVFNFKKETNTNKKDIESGWDYGDYQMWNPNTLYTEAIELQNQYISNNKINTEPLWKIYYESSKIDYLERFHRLWIGLNAYASYHSQHNEDGKKIFDLVNVQVIKDKFYNLIKYNRYTDISNQLLRLNESTGVDTTSNVLRLNITNSNHIIDFMEQCKLHYKTVGVTENLVNDLIFLDKKNGINIFDALYRKYHEYISSSQGIVYPCNFSEIFDDIKSPKSIHQIGRLVFRNHLKSDDDGSLFKMNDFYESNTLDNFYSGINGNQNFEQIDTLFFRYLFLLYKFRSAYFHGDFILNHKTNKLAKFAYLSLLEIFPTDEI